jgi:hypothetical protein
MPSVGLYAAPITPARSSSGTISPAAAGSSIFVGTPHRFCSAAFFSSRATSIADRARNR